MKDKNIIGKIIIILCICVATIEIGIGLGCFILMKTDFNKYQVDYNIGRSFYEEKFNNYN